ncbi:MAG: M3 family oligoendopeptidase [Clostridia bacterium]
MLKFSEMPYKRPEKAPSFAALRAEIKSMEKAGDYSKFKIAILACQKLMSNFYTMSTLVYIRHTIDTSDKFYAAEQKYFDQVEPQLVPIMIKYAKTILASPFKDELAGEFGDHYITIQENTLKKMSPKLVPAMQRQNTLVNEYENLLASCKVDFGGETLNLSGLGKYLQDPNREVRREVSKAISDFLSANSAKLDGLYDKLVKLRTGMGKKMGFDTYTPLGYLNMDRYSYCAQDVAKFREQVISDIVPVCTKLREQQAKRIGVDKIYNYDETFMFTDGNAVPHGSVDEMISAAQRMYRELSDETGDFFDFMVKHELMDLINRPNKRVGGYCTTLHDYEAAFIFSNFNGTAADVDVLTHEAGHAFAGYCANMHNNLLDYLSPTMESCEIHSMSMEFFTHPWMELFFGDAADKYRYAHLLEAFLFIPYGVCVDEFQHVVYENPGMTPAQRNAAWRELEKKYLPHRHYDSEYFEAGGMWQKQHHIYSMPFYYIDYALASISAFEFYGKMKADKATAWHDYFNLCCAGGSKPYRELLKLANLSDPFVPGSVQKAIAAGVDTLMNTNI